jgi:hypothetical protein
MRDERGYAPPGWAVHKVQLNRVDRDGQVVDPDDVATAGGRMLAERQQVADERGDPDHVVAARQARWERQLDGEQVALVRLGLLGGSERVSLIV